MNILKLFDLNSTALKELKTFRGKIVFYGFFYVFMENLSLNVELLSPFVGIEEIW